MASEAANTFQDLIVWQQAHRFVLAVYHYSDYFPQKEIYSLTSQLRSAAISVPAGIAEGFEKKDWAERAHLLNRARGSLEECRYYLILAKDLGYGDSQPLIPQLEEVCELLARYAAVVLDSEI